jgi:nucleotide-binding universal stress UspA family protein
MRFNNLNSAIADYHKARNQAVIKEIVSRITGENIRLLSYDDIRQKLKATGSSERGLHDIPLDKIVGSVNRYDDFTRDFLPRTSISPERWARVEIAVSQPSGLDPIEVYKIGDAYFVKDGNHRVSVARQLGASYIQAYVTEIQTRVPLTADLTPEDLILKAEYAQFLVHTGIDGLRPEADLTLSAPGQYSLLEEHISVHRYYMGIEEQREIPYPEAVIHWYDTFYQPIREVIWSKGILKEFPGRTEADLYLWITEHRVALEEKFGREIKPDQAANDLATQFSPRPDRIFNRLGGKLLNTLLPETLESGPPTGEWRRQKSSGSDEDKLFSEILIAISGRDQAWTTLGQAIEIARREEGRLQGLHVSQPDSLENTGLSLQSEFNRRCEIAGVQGGFLMTKGDITRQISDHSRWSDLIVLHLAYPPPLKPFEALSSGLHKLIQRCSRPILAVPSAAEGAINTNRILLAYDGSPKAEEALYIATYMSGKWGLSLDVLTVFENDHIPPETLLRAQVYLDEHGIQANYIHNRGPAGDLIISTFNEQNYDLLLIGGYGSNPVIDVVLGNVVHQALRKTRRPILICR